jgi:hypothetical protein
MKNLVLAIAVVLFIGCDPYDSRLTIVNNTQDTIFWKLSDKEQEQWSSPVFYDEQNNIVWNESSIVLPDSIDKDYMLGRNGWEDFINERFEDSTLRVFIFEKELVLNTPWDTIVEKQIYTKKYAITVKKLEKLNWRIVYDRKNE